MGLTLDGGTNLHLKPQQLSVHLTFISQMLTGMYTVPAVKLVERNTQITIILEFVSLKDTNDPFW